MIDDLWAELDAVLLDMEPLKLKEREIRAKIKIEQDTRYMDVMGPKLAKMNPSHPGYNNVKNQLEYLSKKYTSN
jgi:hypothetical protein